MGGPGPGLHRWGKLWGICSTHGGAKTPELYKCVVSIAGVSDLIYMLDDTRSHSWKNSRSVIYWNKSIGNTKDDREKLLATSPVNLAQNFTAPVLLLHGGDDTVVPFRQSSIMKGALEKAGKPVELVKLKNEDHWLSQSETRIETLRAMAGFVDRYIGNSQAAPAE